MSLLWPKVPADIVTAQPRLHALVIGVARYPHLVDGTGPKANDQLFLGQVTTPEPTALAIADWLAKQYKNDNQPLGSIELLLSRAGAAPAAGPPTVEPATMDAIEQAFARWVARCSSHKENIAFFYFCGHGLAKDSQYLLPEDFGNPAFPNPWRSCIDFDAMRLGMRSCKAQTQLFFVDACRETPFGMLSQVNVDGEALIGGTLAGSVRSRAVFHATTEGKQAYGPANGVTYFGEAVLSCLDGLASANSQGKWVVDTHSLSAALGKVIEHLGTRYAKPLACDADVSGLAAVIHQPAAPRVLASIECSTAAANASAEIELRRGAETHKAAVHDPKPLEILVTPGDWQVVVTFPGGQFPSPPPLDVLMMPPIFEGVEVP